MLELGLTQALSQLSLGLRPQMRKPQILMSHDTILDMPIEKAKIFIDFGLLKQKNSSNINKNLEKNKIQPLNLSTRGLTDRFVDL
jgi:hypothetical protein